MKLDDMEQVPEGMMDRISEKLALHTAARKKRAVMKTLALAAVLVMLLPISAYAVATMNWGWFQGIELAARHGKSIKLDKEFNYENNTIFFKNAVWQGDTLLISYSVLAGSLLPSQTVLINEHGEVISHGGGGEYDGKGNGTLKLDYENSGLIGDTVRLRVYTLENDKTPVADSLPYDQELSLDKSLLSGSKVKIGREFDTAYGSLMLDEARCENGRIMISYHFKEAQIFSELSNTDQKGRFAFHDVFPKLYLKDGDGTVIQSVGRFSAPEGNSGEINFDGCINNFDKPVKAALLCNETAVNWTVPVSIGNTAPEIIPLNRTVLLDGGTLSLNNLILGSAGTSIDYEFIPDGSQKKTIGIEPQFTMTVNGSSYDAEPDPSGLSGKATFRIPLDKKDRSRAQFQLKTVYRAIAYTKSFTVETGKPLPVSDLQGTALKVTKMEAKNGKTTVELLLDDTRRKFHNFNVSVGTNDRFAAISLGDSMEYPDKELEKRLQDDPDSITQDDVNRTIAKKVVELQGEYDTIQLHIESLIYLDVCKYDFKVK